MKKMLLLSNGLSAVFDILEKNKTIAFIPTAGDTYTDPYFVTEARENLINFGYKVIDLPLTELSEQEVIDRLSLADALFVAGGNSFYLLQEIKKKNLVNIIRKKVEDGLLYIGTSAGAVIACNDIDYVKSIDKPEQAPELKNYNGLALFNKYIIPHADNERYKPLMEKIANELPESILLNDNIALYIEQDSNKQIIKPVISNK